MKFYTNVTQYGSVILHRWVEDGQHKKRAVSFHPTLYIPSNDESSEYKTVYGEPVEPKHPGTIKQCRAFIEQYKEVPNFTVYGTTQYQYQFLAEHYPKHPVEYSFDDLNIYNIDIETTCENGFPDVDNPMEEVNVITIEHRGKYTIWHLPGFDNKKFHEEGYEKLLDTDGKNITTVLCQTEIELLQRFLEFWKDGDYPDIVTGWNVRFFDIPYLYERIKSLFDEDEANALSPWNVVRRQEVRKWNRDQTAYSIAGVSTLDYMELYRNFTYTAQESYSLDNISYVELKKKKLDYEEYGHLHTFYRNNFTKFVVYNIHDVELVAQLEDKMRLLELAVTMAYDAKCSFDDVFSQVRMWDVIIFNELYRQRKVIPPKTDHSKDAAYEGAYVKDPQLGAHDWIVSFDLASLYPHLIMQYNISPETLIDGIDTPASNTETSNLVSGLLDQKIDTSDLKTHNVCLTANRQFFRTDVSGFLPKIMQRMYDDRKKYKKEMLKAKAAKVKAKSKAEENKLEKDVSKFENLQKSKKIQLNSAYGALGNEYFRFFDIRIAEAITLSGQLSIRWIENNVNRFMNELLDTKNEDYIIAVDTDSIYVRFGPLVKKVFGDNQVEPEKIINFLEKACNEKIKDFIDQTYIKLAKYVNAYQQKMMMDREVIASRGIWTAKKRYVLDVWDSEGVRYEKPELKIMGLEAIKSSTPEPCRKKIKEVLKIALRENEDAVINFIKDFRKEFYKLPAEEVAFPRSITGIDKYSHPVTVFKKSTPMHVKGALLFNHLLKKMEMDKDYRPIQDHDKIKFIHMRVPNPARGPVVAFRDFLPDEIGLDEYVDYKTQFEKTFLDPLKIVLDKIGWKTERQATLDAFMV